MYKTIFLGLSYQEYYIILKDEYKVYQKHFDTFLDAAIIGCMENNFIYSDDPDTQNEKTRVRIEGGVILNNKSKFDLIANLITFIHYSRMDDQKILSKMFLDTNEALQHKQSIVENYARGGIKNLYEGIVGNSTSKDDILENIVIFSRDIYDIIEFKDDFGDMDTIIGRLV
jgi:hypothetical protein